MAPANDATAVDKFMVNDRTVDIHITTHGSDWYWAVTSVMGSTMLVVIGLSFRKSRTDRIFHYLLATVALVAMIEHYSMAANLGWVPIDVEWRRPTSHGVSGVNRQIWWVRYIGWAIIWPLLALTVQLTIALPTASIFWTSFLSVTMAVMAVVGAMVRTVFKWGYYGFWCGAWMALFFYLVWYPQRYAKAFGRDRRRTYSLSAGWIWFVWMLYPVCWGLCEGGNVLTPDSEFIWYGIIDCVLIPVFTAGFLWIHRNIDVALLGISIRDFDGPIGRFYVADAVPVEKDDNVTNGASHVTNNGPSNAPTSESA